MKINQLLHHCPHCGGGSFPEISPSHFACADCGFHYYLNAAAAVGAILLDDEGRMLWVRRAKEPSKGKLGLPGGFVDFNETAEQALVREVREELKLEITTPRYLCSYPNQYLYRGCTYQTLDLFFTCKTPSFEPVLDHGEVESILLLRPSETDPDQVAFPSMQHALQQFIKTIT